MQDENGYTTIDLDADPKKGVEQEIEIVVDDEPKAVEPEVVVEDDEEEAPKGEEKGKLTRHQRLKASRDKAWQEAEEAKAEAAAAKAELERIKSEANSAADVTYDYMLGTLDSKLKGFKDSYNQALATGDQEKLFDLQVQIAETVASKRQMEASKPTRPPQGASGKDTPPTTEATPTRKPQQRLSAAAREWQEENGGWLNKDRGMTAVAKAIAEDLVAEGWAEMDNDYFDELDRRLKAEMPHKFKRKEAPTITSRGQQQAPTGKLVVRLSQEEKALASKMGVDIKEFARQKALMEAAGKSDGYTEV
jgi:hypothetical protein